MLIGESVSVLVEADSIVVRHGTPAVAHHARLGGQRQRAIEPAHFDGLVGRAFQRRTEGEAAPLSGELARPLADYEAVTGGRF